VTAAAAISIVVEELNFFAAARAQSSAHAPRVDRPCFPVAVRELAPPGDVATAAQKPLTFEFRNVEMQNDSYRGLQVRCRCALLAVCSRAHCAPCASS
jgi:hypothetical protein